MKSRYTRRRRGLYVTPLALLLANGCLATLQGNLDLLLGARAAENALALPYSSVAALAELFWRAWGG